MRRGFLPALLLVLFLATPVSAAATSDQDDCTVIPDGSKVEVTYPPLSHSKNLVFWNIPWQLGDKVAGSVQLKTTEPLPNLTIRMSGGAPSLDSGSRRIIPAGRVAFTRTDQTTQAAAGSTTTTVAAGTHLFNFIADEIPGADTYCAHLEAVWGEPGKEVRQTLPSLKLKVYPDATARVVSGRQLEAQWTNLDAPLAFLWPLEFFQRLSPDEFFSRYNPEPALRFTMPGSSNVASQDTFDVQITLDPVLDENNNPTSQVFFWIQSGESDRPQTGQETQRVKVTVNDSFAVLVSRKYSMSNGRLTAPRIPPGKYHTTLRIKTPWGEQDQPVTLMVRDAPLWPVLTLIFGIVFSLMATYWDARRPLYQARRRARRWRHCYILQGVRLTVVEWAIQHLNLSAAGDDVAGTERAADLLEGLVRSQPDTLVVESVIQELLSMPGVSPAVVQAAVTQAGSVAEARENLRLFCAGDPDPAVQGLGKSLENPGWHGEINPPPMAEASAGESLRATFGQWLSSWFLDLRRSANRIFAPGFWDLAIMLTSLVLVNGAMIILQMVEVYANDQTFGTTTDYLNLLFWGFAGDTTRKKLMDLVGKVVPTRTVAAGSGSTAPSGSTPIVGG